MSDYPIPTQRLLAYIQTHNLAPGVPMPTVPLAAAAIGAHQNQILKSLLFRATDGRLILAIAAGPTRIDRAKLAAASGLTNLKLADPALVLATTGYPAGGVAPIAHSSPIPVILDHHAAALDVAYGGGGAEHLLLRIHPGDIIRLTTALVADISSPSPT